MYLVYTCTQNEIAFFIPLKGKDGAFVLTECAGQVTCGNTTETKCVLKNYNTEPLWIQRTQNGSPPDLKYTQLIQW